MRKVLGPFPGLYSQFLEFNPSDQQESSLPEQKEEEISQEERKSEESPQLSVAERNVAAEPMSDIGIQPKLNGRFDDEQVLDALKETLESNTPLYEEIMKCLSLYSLVS